MRQRAELETAGERILELTKTELCLDMRFLSAALDRLKPKMDLATRTVGTDGVFIRYNPLFLYSEYLEHPHRVERTYLHMLLHCVFLHMYTRETEPDPELFDLSSDLAAEAVIDSMELPRFGRVISDFRTETYEWLRKGAGVLTAERICRFLKKEGIDWARREKLEREFTLCDHSFWERLPKEKKRDGAEQGRQEALPTDGKRSWEQAGQRVQSGLETFFSPDREKREGTLLKLLRFRSMRRTDYREYLKRFTAREEELGIDPESFDYAYYYYGLMRYGNMPLLEELEYRERRRVKELVIAIDTSASCQPRLVQRFLNETGAIFRNAESFFRKVSVRIIECDDRVRNDLVLDSPEKIFSYAEHFEVSGGYGTDFRPVFAYVDELVHQKQFRNLGGLLYFTDGFGTFPKNAPSYETAFVFRTDELFDDRNVPPWAISLYIDGDGEEENEH